MTISSTTRQAGPFAGNGVTVAFPFAFKIFTAADLRVVSIDADGVQTELALTTDYSVTLNADQNVAPGGTATVVSAPITGESLVITSDLAALQPVNLTNAGGFYPRVINDALDRLTILVQQLLGIAARAILVPFGEAAFTVPPLDQRKNRIALWQSDGSLGAADGVVNISGSGATAALTAVGGETSVDVGLPLSAAWLLELFRDGVRQRPVYDYTVGSGTSINLTTPAVAGESFWWVHTGGASTPDFEVVGGDAFLDKTFSIYGTVTHRGLRDRFINEGVRVTEALSQGYLDDLGDDLQALIDDKCPAVGGKLIIDGFFYTNPVNLRGTAADKFALTVEGQGIWRTGLLANDGVLEEHMLLRASGGRGFELRDFSIDCRKAAQNGGVMPPIIDPNYEKYGGVWFYDDCEDVLIERLRVINAPLIGVSSGAPHLGFGGVTNFRAVDVIYEGCGGGQAGMRMTGGYTRGVTALDFYGIAVVCDYESEGHQISNVRAVGRGPTVGNAAVMTYRAKDISISHVHAEQCPQAVLVQGVSERVSMTHIHGRDMTSGVRFHENSFDCSLSHFGFQDLAEYGVIAYGSWRCKISDGTILRAGFSGIAGLTAGGTSDANDLAVARVDIIDTGGGGVLVQDAERLSLDTVTVRNSSKAGAGTFAGVTLNGVAKANLRNVRAIDDAGVHTQSYGLETQGLCDVLITGGEYATGNLSGAALFSGGTTRVMRDAGGIASATTGIQAFAAGDTAKTVNHGLVGTPPFGLVQAEFVGAPGASATLSVRNITSTTFDIVLNAAPGVGINVGWNARLNA